MTVTSMATAMYPARPATEPIKGTLLSVADTPDTGIKWLASADHMTEEMWNSFNCMKFQHVPTRCAQSAKTFDQPMPWQSGFYFAVYGGAHCKSIGLDQAEMKSEIARVFETGESIGIEQAFMAQRFALGPDRDPGAGVDSAWLAPVDVNAAGAVKPVLGVAKLESYAASTYAGVPTIHIPRSIATLMWGLGALQWDGDILRTKLGSKVAAGPGYDYPNTGPDGSPAATGEKWIYATGEVQILKGPPIIKQILSTSDNEVFVLAERAYIGVVDCFTAAVRVQETT